MPVRVAIVCPSVVKYDAISTAARDTYFALANEPDFEPTLLTSRTDMEDLPAEVIIGVKDLLLNPVFIAADLIIYHFGFHNEWFNVLIARAGRTAQIVRFHNITPVHLAPRGYETSFEKSFQQIHSLKYSDEIWADSNVNAAVLREYGVDDSQIKVIPLVVESPALARLRDKAVAPLEILFIGRFVPSKGVLDLIEAVDLVRRKSSVPFRLSLIGNLEWADGNYVRKIEHAIAAEGPGLRELVDFCGTVDDATRARLLHAAHILAIPSYHEGFCKPVIEALRSGAVPVGYAAYNVPAATNGLGRLVPPGNKQALAAALLEVMEGISSVFATPSKAKLPLDRGPTSLTDFDNATREHVSQFTFDRIAPVMMARARYVLGQGAEGKPGSAMNHAQRNFPSLTRHDVDSTARVFATRDDLIEALNIPLGNAIAEVGVALGDFSEFLIQSLQPSRFVAIDTFALHKLPELWGRSTAGIFGQQSHLDYYRSRFARYGNRIAVEAGPSQEMLARCPDETFALIYIDAAHDYESVSRDLDLATRKVKKDGTIILKDYTAGDHIAGVEYGIVPAVNELVAQGEWRVVGFALQQQMFCDIAIRRFNSNARVSRNIDSVSENRLSAEQVPSSGRVRANTPRINPRIIVMPDDILREIKRDSLNRICSISDWSGWNGLPGMMMQLNDWVGVHRKSWEFALCITGLEQLGVVSENAVALSVGAGYERPLYYFANKISKMIATDLYNNELAEGRPDMLTSPEKYAPFPYRKDHLQVLRMPGDDLKFDDQSFDFVFSLSSIEHFGSRAIQRKSLSEMTRVTRPGGVICIATELLLNDTRHVEYFTLEELEEIFLHAEGLRLDGGELDLRIAKSLIDYPLDLDHTANIHSSPHITLKQGENLWTSVILFLRRIG